MRKTVTFERIPVRIELRAPMPDGRGGSISYSNVAFVLADVELQTPLSLTIEGGEDDDALFALRKALQLAAVAGREVAIDQFFDLLDRLEERMSERLEIQL